MTQLSRLKNAQNEHTSRTPMHVLRTLRCSSPVILVQLTVPNIKQIITSGCTNCKFFRVLYPWLRVEIPESKIEIVGGLPPRLLPPVGMKPLDLEIDGHLRPLATAKGDGLTKLAPQLPIGSLQEGGSADPFSRDRLKRIVDQGLLKVAFERRHGFGSSLSPLLSPCC